MIQLDNSSMLYTSSLLSVQGITHGFSTKPLGDGTEESVLLTFFNNCKTIVDPKQTHSTHVARYMRSPRDKKLVSIPDTDGVVTTESDATLVIQTADCVPLLFSDTKKGIVGAAHLGWRGTLNGLGKEMVKEMMQAGSSTRNLHVAIGPCIGGCCYNIPPERVELITSRFPEESPQVLTHNDENTYLHLARLNYLLLIKAGVPKENIDYFPFCTKCNEERFYSFRREGKALSGEIFSFIMRV